MSQRKPLPDHSAAKIRLLGAYLKRFLSVISNDGFTQQIDIYDLFCGEGQGSPTVIMSEVLNSFSSRRDRKLDNPTINCWFNDIDPVNVENTKIQLEKRNPEHLEVGSLNFTCKDYSDFVANLRKSLVLDRFKKTFIFMDPWGYKHIKASDIQDLMRKGNVEILLFLPTQFMYRFDANGTPEALIDFIEEIVDYKRWKPTDSVWEFIEQLNAALRNNLGERVFVDTFTIQKDPQTVFCLFFFSSHIKGFEKMLEAKWEIDHEQGKGWHYSRSQSSSLFEQLKTHPLELKLRGFLRDNVRTNGAIYEFTLRSGFLPKHACEVFENLQENGELVVTRRTGEKVRRKAFYLNYKTYRDEHDKVSFKLG